MIKRNLLEYISKSNKSILLIGPRQTGKSTLMHLLKPDISINLMKETTFFEFTRNPYELENRLAAVDRGVIFIDEIQRLPSLLNTIQVYLDENPKKFRFFLTGSSARKLRRGSANLLPGRVHAFEIGSLVASELEYQLDTRRALAYGTLPGIYTEKDKVSNEMTLSSYAATYLKEEVQTESLTKNIEGFSRFLNLAGIESSKFLDLAKLASESGVPRETAGRFFEILEDTLIVRRCEAFSKSSRMRLVQHPRYFFFDTGVMNGLLGNFMVSPDRIGALFETLLFNQLKDSAASQNRTIRISSYRTSAGAEVDFIVEEKDKLWAIEAKASRNVGQADLTGLKSFEGFYKKPHYPVVAYLGETHKKIGNVDILPWQDLLKKMKL